MFRLRKLACLCALVVEIFAASCSSPSTEASATGGERQHCYSNGTCNAGLTCFSDFCVRYDAGGNTTGGMAGQELGGAGAVGAGGAGEGGGLSFDSSVSAGSGIGGAINVGGTSSDASGDAVDANLPQRDASADRVAVPDAAAVCRTAGDETIMAPGCGWEGAVTTFAYSGRVTLMLSGHVGTIAGTGFWDALYSLDPTAEPCPTCIRFNRLSDGKCLCENPSMCPNASHTLGEILVGPYPAVNAQENYTVQIDLGARAPERLAFAFRSCDCVPHVGSYTITLSGGVVCN